MNLSIIIPVFNEEKNIFKIIQKIKKFSIIKVFKLYLLMTILMTVQELF